MGILFSKVTATSNNDEICEFYCSGIPSFHDELLSSPDYEDFIDNNSFSDLEINIESYIYGEGETVKADIKDILNLTSEEDFLSHPDVQLIEESSLFVELTNEYPTL